MRLPRFSLLNCILDAPYLAAIVAFAIGIVAFAITQALVDGIAAVTAKNELLFLDFTKYYVFSKIALSADRADIFNLGVQLEWTRQILGNLHWSKAWISEYPPYFGVLF